MKKLLRIVFFIFAIFLQIFSISHAQVETLFPYKIDFTEAEKKLLNTLDSKTLEKLLQVAKLIIQKNKENQNQTQVLPSTLNGTNQLTQTSQVPTASTPYYNPQTGQYQNTPSQNASNQNAFNNAQTGNPFMPQQSPYQQDPFSQQSQVPNTPLGALAKGVDDGFTSATQNPSLCSGALMSHQESIQKMREIGVDVPNTKTSFDKLPSGIILLLKKIQTECKCKLTVTSGTRSFGSTATPRPNSHYPGNMVVDLAYDSQVSNYIRSKGGNVCRPSFDGINFIDEGKCPIAGVSQGAHWHMDARGWKCK